MHAYVYKSLRKADTYLYLAARDDFARVPPPVLDPLGRLEFVLDVALTADRKLARVDPAVVRDLVRKALEVVPLDAAIEVKLNPEDLGALEGHLVPGDVPLRVHPG